MLIYTCINLLYELCGDIMNDRRTSKYEVSENSPRRSRVDKHEKIYDEMNNKIGYSEAIDLTNGATIDLNGLEETRRNRENYQSVKEVQNIIAPKEEPISKEIKKEDIIDTKSFDINVILEEAKKNRSEVDDLEKKRNLKDNDYNILTNLNRKYLHKKDITQDDTEELQELIDTITQNSISKEINDDNNELLSELMNTAIKPELLKELEEAQNNNSSEEKQEELTNSFYTKSMEITDADFDIKEELNTEIKKSNTLVIVIVALILLLLAGVIAFFTLRHFGINIF